MGILETIDQTYKEGVDAVIDNDALSVQDTVRGGIMAATGQYGQGAEEFREDSQAVLNSVSGAMDAPAQAINQATKGTPLNNAATDALEEGGETAYEMFGEYPAAVAYGTATGSDLRGVAKEDTKTDYTPGILDSLELAWVGGPASKVASRGGRAVAKAAKSSDEAAKAASAGAGGGTSMGILSGLRKMVSKSDEAADAASDAARASDEAASTQTTLDAQFANRASRTTETLEDAAPDESMFDPIREAASSRANQAVVGGTVAAGAGWSLMGGGSGGVGGSLPDGYRVAAKVNAEPGGVIVERVGSEGESMGFWAIAGREGSDYVSVVSRSGGFGTTPVSFAGSPSPPYDSQSQARQAFRTWAQQQSSGGEPTNAENNSREQPSSPWGEAEVVTPLNNGWYLAEQEHKQEEKYRYLVAGRDGNGSLLFVGPGGTTTTSPQTFTSRENAMSAYRAWKGTDSSSAPDPAQQRPTSSDLLDELRGSGPTGSGGGGSLGFFGLLAAGGAAAALAALVYKVVVQ